MLPPGMLASVLHIKPCVLASLETNNVSHPHVHFGSWLCHPLTTYKFHRTDSHGDWHRRKAAASNSIIHELRRRHLTLNIVLFSERTRYCRVSPE